MIASTAQLTKDPNNKKNKPFKMDVCLMTTIKC